MKKIARVIITLTCNRSCTYCCNTYGSIMQHARECSIDEVKGFSSICITGGEPMLNPQRTLEIIARVRSINPSATIYLYTALYRAKYMELILKAVDGVHFTLHAASTQKDVDSFYAFQALIAGRKGSFRAYVHPDVDYPIDVDNDVWVRFERKPWMTEEELQELQPDGLPVGEELLILK